jgi:hypothetical protein
MCERLHDRACSLATRSQRMQHAARHARVQRMNKLSASVRAWATDVNNDEENVWTLGSTR